MAVTVLIPNERGLDNALELRDRFQEVNLFLSASETHNRRNVNRSIEESLTGLERVVERARGEGLRCEGVISVSFGCPYEGEVPEERVLGIARRLADGRLRGGGLRRHHRHGQPAPGARASSSAPRAELGRGAHRPLPQHPRAGAGERAGRARGGRALVRVLVRRARRLPGAARAPRATWPPRTWCRCCTRWGTTPASTSPRSWRAAGEAQRVLGRPLGSHVLTAGPVDWRAAVTPERRGERARRRGGAGRDDARLGRRRASARPPSGPRGGCASSAPRTCGSSPSATSAPSRYAQGAHFAAGALAARGGRRAAGGRRAGVVRARLQRARAVVAGAAARGRGRQRVGTAAGAR